MQRQEILERLEAMAQEKFRTQTLIPGRRKAIGVSNPDMRRLAKQIAADDPFGFLESNPQEYFEEQMLYAFVLGCAKGDFERKLKLFTRQFSNISDWACTDALCNDMKDIRKHREETLKAITPYVSSHNEFEVRCVAVTLLSHYVTEDYRDTVAELLPKLDTSDYYAMMGTAWAAAELVCRYPQYGIGFIGKRLLDERTHNRAIQKACESFRVSDEDKIILRKMKIQPLG